MFVIHVLNPWREMSTPYFFNKVLEDLQEN